MRSILSESISWLKGSKYGYTYKDKIVLFLYISNAIIIIIFIISIFGKNKAIDIYFKRTYLLNWIPIKSVLVKRDGVMLSLPMILDYIILVKPDWEEKEREFMTQLNLNYNNNNAIVMDIGANIGIYTILLSHIYPKAKIISIEASPSIFEILKSNCKLNNLLFPGSNVLLINKAISDKDDITTEFYEKHSMSTMLKEFLTNLSSTILTNQDELNKRVVRTITIDNLVETIGVNEISLLKIDVEGAEVLALNGAIKTLTHKKIKNIVIEYHSLENYNYIIKLLEEEELGYTIIDSQERFNKEKEFVNGNIMAILQE